MKEKHLFDDIARTLASPIPRRQALGRIVGGLAGAALASVFGIESAWADKPGGCPPGQPACGTVCCPKGWDCCSSTASLCCNPSTHCDGTKCKTVPSPGGSGGNGA